MSITVGQKARQALDFLLGLRSPRAVGALAQHGFGPADVEEGWSLLRALSTVRFSVDKGPTQVSPKVVAEVDAWENRWFTIIEASLARRFPEIRDKVFLNLSQTDGPPVLLSVRVLLDRVNALNAAAASDREKEAFALLTQRGLSTAVLAEVQALLGAAEVPVAEAPVDAEDLAEQQTKAEEALWAWYQEWATIARRAVSDRRVLRALGFLRRPRTSGEEADDELPAPPVAPVPPTPAPV